MRDPFIGYIQPLIGRLQRAKRDRRQPQERAERCYKERARRVQHDAQRRSSCLQVAKVRAAYFFFDAAFLLDGEPFGEPFLFLRMLSKLTALFLAERRSAGVSFPLTARHFTPFLNVPDFFL